MSSKESKTRDAICALGAKLAARGLCPGTSGNISARIDDGWLMTPTNSSLFGDFFFRGQLNGQGNTVGTVNVSVIDSANLSFSSSFTNQANQDFASFGVLSLDGETIKSLTVLSGANPFIFST